MKVTQGMVLAAGRGERMRPLTDVMPKPMIEVAGRSMVDRAIDRLVEAGVEKLVVNTSYKAEMLEAHLSARSSSIIFSREAVALETGGGIAQALHHFGEEPFFAVNGDIIWMDGTVPALQRLAAAWEEGMDALLLLHPVESAVGYSGKGDFFLTSGGELERRGERGVAPYVYAGVQLLHPRLFAGAPDGAFSLNVLYNRAMAKTLPTIKTIVHDGQWLHVGDVAGKEQAEQALRAS